MVLKKAILNNSLNWPSPEKASLKNYFFKELLWDKETLAPFLFVADDAFSLSQNIMKPYPQTNLSDKKQIFCYRISHFCRVHENSLEFWVVDFGSFWNLNLTPETAVDAILATIRLHNLLQFKSCESYTIPHFVDELEGGQVIHQGSWRQDNTQNMLPLPTHKQNNISKKC